jgi:glyoxylase I family protein
MTAVRLTHAAIMTAQLDKAVAFYRDLLGLVVRSIEDDPIRKGRKRALLTDIDGSDVIEIIEMNEMTHHSIPGKGGVHHVGFILPTRDWHGLRSRLDAQGWAYQEVGGYLFVRDADGLVLEIGRN